VVPLPPELDGQPFPGRAARLRDEHLPPQRDPRRETIAIVGIGFLGALLTRLAADAGARVIAISRRGFALDVARRMGAAETIPMDDHWRIIEQVKELTGGAFCDA
jgi:threonine dehydrogenase-like Zn-dependent dehydrogenase